MREKRREGSIAALIREERERGRFLRSIAGSFGISTSQVRNIVTGKSWREAA